MKLKETKFWVKSVQIAKKIGTRNLILIGTVLVIGLAICLNYLLQPDALDSIGYGTNNMEDTYKDADAVDNANETDAYFASTILNRQQARDEALEVLRTVAQSSEALEATKAQALSDIAVIAKDIETEANIESLIIAKGFEQCIVVINGDKASVVVKTDGLLESEVAQIAEIVYEQAGIAPINLHITEKN